MKIFLRAFIALIVTVSAVLVATPALPANATAGCGVNCTNVSGNLNVLAQELVAGDFYSQGPNIIDDQIRPYANGLPISPECEQDGRVLQTLVVLLRTFGGVGISDLGRHCNNDGTNTCGKPSNHCDIPNRAIDIISVGGEGVDGANSRSMEVFQLMQTFMPQGLHVGQLDCRQAAGIGPLGGRLSNEFNDDCHHIHIDFSTASGPLDVEGTSTPPPPQSPIGSVDPMTTKVTTSTKLVVPGWGIDRGNSDTNAAANVKLKVTGPSGFNQTVSVSATAPREDVGDAFPTFGDNHGFSREFAITAGGSYKACGWVVVGTTETSIGCQTASVYAGRLPTITGTVAVGSVLSTSASGVWNPAPTTQTYQWQANNVNISGATGSTFTVRQADAGKKISVVVTPNTTGYQNTPRKATTASTATIPGLTFTRVSGADRYASSVEMSKAGFASVGSGVPVVWVASGESFPDALSAGPAAAKMGGPLLLTAAASLPASVSAEINRLNPTKIVVAGGTDSVSQAVFNQLNAIAPATRVGGANRYEVSRNIVAYAFKSLATRGSTIKTYIATGADYPDAMSASAAAAAESKPLLLVDGGASSLDSATTSALNTLGPSSFVVVGGTSSVSTGIQSSLGSIATTARVNGSDRYGTSYEANKSVYASASKVFITTGSNYPDALPAIPLAAKVNGPLFLTQTNCIPSNVLTRAQLLGATNITILGGPNSVAEAVTAPTAC